MANKYQLEERIAKANEKLEKKNALIKKMTIRIEKNIKKIMTFGFSENEANNISKMEFFDLRHTYTNRNLNELTEIHNIVFTIQSAQESIRNAEKEIQKTELKLTDYTAQLDKILAIEKSRTIKPILDFLEVWKKRVKDYYLESFTAYVQAMNHAKSEYQKYNDWYYHEKGMNESEEIQKEKKQSVIDARKAVERFQFLERYIAYEVQDNSTLSVPVVNHQKLDQHLQIEAENKYDNIVNRAVEITGKILDATDLSIGSTGEFNGIIVGENGKAKIETIGAGGYNIQCFHFRTLIPKIN